MRCLDVAELPPPPAGKSGWPWTEDSPRLAFLRAGGRPRLRTSIVTPSYNQGPFLEETVRSVLLQGYPDLEYHIVDGGSRDGSVDTIRKYERWLASWSSEPDGGQADAINKGFGRATGEIYGWLNSDDVYEPGALQEVGGHFAARQQCALLYGNGWYVDVDGHKTRPCDWIRPFDRQLLLTFNFILQPAAFWRRGLWEQTGGLDPSCHWAMDWEWLIRATRQAEPDYLPVSLSRWRIRPEIKTLSGGEARRAEIAAICKRYGGTRQPTYRLYQLDRLARRMDGGPGSRWLGVLIAAMGYSLRRTIWRRRCLY